MSQKQNCLAHRGLTVPRVVLRRLDKVGIFAQPNVSLEHQHLARRYVVRGLESGGAVRELGRYITFCGTDGEPLPYLHLVDAIGVNGVHAVVIASDLIRIELFRTGRTCQLLITEHKPGPAENGRRPRLENKILFRGVNGFLDTRLRTTNDRATDLTLPEFWTRGGDKQEIPSRFLAAVQGATKGAICVGCSHTHFLTVPSGLAVDADTLGSEAFPIQRMG